MSSADNQGARVSLVTIDSTHPPEKILSLSERRQVGICFDGSPSSRHAFDWAFSRVLLPYQDHLYFLVADDFAETDFEILKKSFSGSRHKSSLELVEAEIKHLMKDLIDIGITSQIVIRKSSAKKFIPAAVDELKIEALIIGSRGNSLAKRVVFGSTSSYLLNKVSCPVIVVKGGDSKPNLEDTPLEKVATRDSLRLVKTISREENPSVAIARSRNREEF
ncbi:hypothetical protein BB560_002320 [Smittium megazygosporum]|uniref:UspA domain-containing protein n=1 Tax=Smittium megazygosporum TaxID=133381 RepID=A0A2T9ZF42_9FUNG|nr:hypothetical protein BB560_002320 [Smittium megazygosporum]